jgi:predicted nucleotidyltransferase component of viral defense system
MFEPHLEVLPLPQRDLWGELAQVPSHLVLYGGTALSLRLAHRQSFDFDFFSSRRLDNDELLTRLPLLRGAKVLQNVGQTLTTEIDRQGSVKLSFFGEISIGRVGMPEKTADGVLKVASLLDLAGTKAKVLLQRAESKDYLDLLAIFKSGISLAEAMAAARALYGEHYNPILTIKSLTYFGDGDLHKLTPDQKHQLEQIVSVQNFTLPNMQRLGNDLSGET